MFQKGICVNLYVTIKSLFFYIIFWWQIYHADAIPDIDFCCNSNENWAKI